MRSPEAGGVEEKKGGKVYVLVISEPFLQRKPIALLPAWGCAPALPAGGGIAVRRRRRRVSELHRVKDITKDSGE